MLHHLNPANSPQYVWQVSAKAALASSTDSTAISARSFALIFSPSSDFDTVERASGRPVPFDHDQEADGGEGCTKRAQTSVSLPLAWEAIQANKASDNNDLGGTYF